MIKHENMEYKRAVHYTAVVLELCAKTRKFVRELFESPEMERMMRHKLRAIDGAIRAKARKIAELQTMFEIAKRELNDVAEESISRLII